MPSRDEILRILSENKSDLAKRFKVRRLALFGSFARGDNTHTSDIDILVDVDPDIGLDFVVLADTIEHLIGAEVDVVSLRAIKPRFSNIVEQESIDV
jgi:uncharacterized protein